MMKYIKYTIFIVFIVLLIGNTYLFISGIKLGNDVLKFETGIQQYQLDNTELEKKVSEVSSLQHVASLAATMNYQEAAQPIVLDNLKYALNN